MAYIPPDRTDPTPPTHRHNVLLTLGMLAAPVLWLCSFQTLYAIALWSDHTGKKWPLHVTSAVTLLLLLGGIIYARTRGVASPTDPTERERFELMRSIGWAFAALFALGVVAQWVAVFLVRTGVD